MSDLRICPHNRFRSECGDCDAYESDLQTSQGGINTALADLKREHDAATKPPTDVLTFTSRDNLIKLIASLRARLTAAEAKTDGILAIAREHLGGRSCEYCRRIDRAFDSPASGGTHET